MKNDNKKQYRTIHEEWMRMISKQIDDNLTVEEMERLKSLGRRLNKAEAKRFREPKGD